METAAQGRSVPPLLTAIRHHLVALISVVVLLMGLALAFVASTTPVYTASSVLLLSPAPGNPLTPDETASAARLTVAMETESGLVTTPTVAEMTSEALGRAVPIEPEQVRAHSPSGSQMLTISFTSTSAERAQEGAQAFADTYLAYREDRATTNQAGRIERLEGQVASTEDDLAQAVAAGIENPLSAEQVDIYSTRLADLNAEISAVRIESTEPGRVITPAQEPSSPAGTSPLVILVAAGVGGLLFGALLALFLEWRRDLVREGDEFEVSGVPVFARLPHRTPPGLVAGAQHESREGAAAHEAYRRLRAGVVANGPRPHVLGVAAVGEHEHASAVVANLAVALAEARFSVLIIAADPRGHEVEGLFGISHSPGLAESLRGTTDPRNAVRSISGVSILPGGTDAFEARELYAGQGFRDLVEGLRSEYDYVLIAASSTGTADGDAAIGSADSVLLSVTSSRITHAQVAAALDRFQRLGIHPLGAVNVPPSGRRGLREAAHSEHEDTPAAGTSDESVQQVSRASA